MSFGCGYNAQTMSKEVIQEYLHVQATSSTIKVNSKDEEPKDIELSLDIL